MFNLGRSRPHHPRRATFHVKTMFLKKCILFGIEMIVSAGFAIAGDQAMLVDLVSTSPSATEVSPTLVSCKQDGSNVVISTQISHWSNLNMIEKRTLVTNSVCRVGFIQVYEGMGKGIRQTTNVTWVIPGRRISELGKVQVFDFGEFNLKFDRSKE